MSSKSRRARAHSSRELDAAGRNHAEHRPPGIPAIPDRCAKARRLFRRGATTTTTHNENKGETTVSDPIPLSALQLEGIGHGQSLESLERQLTAAGHQVITDYIGRRCVSRNDARAVLAEKLAADEAERERAQRRAAENKARLAQLTARNKATRRRGIPATPGSTALADLLTGDQP